MIDDQSFYTGLALIGIQLNQPVGKDVQRAFHVALEDETTAEEWQAFVRVAVKRFRWTFLPAVPALLDALMEFRGAPKLEAEAVVAYDRVLGAGTYQPEGTHWSFWAIVETCGKAAAEAFLEAGGDSAFGVSDAEKGGYRDAERRKKFIAAYTLAARQEPNARLSPGRHALVSLARAYVEEARKLLPCEHQITKGEAADLLAKIALNAGEVA